MLGQHNQPALTLFGRRGVGVGECVRVCVCVCARARARVLLIDFLFSDRHSETERGDEKCPAVNTTTILVLNIFFFLVLFAITSEYIDRANKYRVMKSMVIVRIINSTSCESIALTVGSLSKVCFPDEKRTNRRPKKHKLTLKIDKGKNSVTK